MDLVALLFRAGGRMNRAKYWFFGLVFAVATALTLGFAVLSFGTAVRSGFAFARLLVFYGDSALAIALLYSYTVVTIKRLHDRGKSGYWVLLFLYAPYFPYGTAMAGGRSAMLSLAVFAIAAWGFVELYCLQGTNGANAYGPDPVA